MTSTTRNKSVPPQSLQERLARSWRRTVLPGDLTILVVTFVLLLLPGLALQAAEWPLTMQVVVPITLLSVIFGFLLARSQYNELLALLISTGYGVCLLFILAAMTIPGGMYDLISRTVTWIYDAFTGGINTDEIVLTLLVGLLFWFLGYNAAWHVFRIDRVWRVILPPALILVTTAVIPGSANLDLYLIAFTFFALVMIARSNIDAREWEWYSNGIRVPRGLRQQFMRFSAVLALVVLLAAWIVPSGDLQDRLDSFQAFLSSDPMEQVNELLNRLFAPIAAEGPTSADYYGGESLELSGAIRLGDQPVLAVQVQPDRRYYWRSRVFDTYELGRWTPGASIRLTTSEAPLNINWEVTAARTPVEQTYVSLLRSSRLIYTAPQPSQVNLPTRTDLQYVSEIEPRYMNVSVIRPLRVIGQGESYTTTSLVSIATADQLRNAGTNYPAWIANHPQYLRDSEWVISQATRDLAQNIVNAAGATTPYDKAKAIESWLRANITYNETIPQPPAGIDPVDWVLFDTREGYCNYYATAMIVMLRSQDVPARMAAGFAQGTWDDAQQAFIVRERDSHTWVEAYFPGFGWIEFEPTSAQAPLNREGDLTVAQAAVPPENQPTPTPTATLTPSPQPATPTAPPTEPQSTEDPQTPEAPSITPTFTPSPTATPVIIPTMPPPTTPQAADPLSFILPALGLALLGVLLIALVIATVIFIWWYWEWRGMGGLSPIARAYARLERYLVLIGIRFQPEQTPEERRRRTLRDLPGAERPVTAITRMYITERYGPRQPVDTERQSEIADKAWSDARGSILRRWLRRFRFRGRQR